MLYGSEKHQSDSHSSLIQVPTCWRVSVLRERPGLQAGQFRTPFQNPWNPNTWTPITTRILALQLNSELPLCLMKLQLGSADGGLFPQTFLSPFKDRIMLRSESRTWRPPTSNKDLQSRPLIWDFYSFSHFLMMKFVKPLMLRNIVFNVSSHIFNSDSTWITFLSPQPFFHHPAMNLVSVFLRS